MRTDCTFLPGDWASSNNGINSTPNNVYKCFIFFLSFFIGPSLLHVVMVADHRGTSFCSAGQYKLVTHLVIAFPDKWIVAVYDLFKIFLPGCSQVPVHYLVLNIQEVRLVNGSEVIDVR